jgi:hypothetical protein
MKHPLSYLCLGLALCGFAGGCDDDSSPSESTATASPTPAPVPTVLPTLPPPSPPPAGNQPPVPNFRITPFPTTGPAPLVVNFNLCPTADPDGDHIIFFFDYGDGTTAQGPPCRQQNTYRRGRFTANMCVWDSRPEHSLECVAFPVDSK